MKVIDVEHVYLGYTALCPTGTPATDRHTEIEMGAKEKRRKERQGVMMGGRGIKQAGGKVDEKKS